MDGSLNGKSLSVVIPAYNEEKRLPKTVQDIERYLLANGYDAEILIVDDGSRDHTKQEAEALEKSLTLVRAISYPKNQGKGNAVRTGILEATRQLVVYTDADHSTPIDEVVPFAEYVDRGYGVVIGSRRVRQSELLVRQPLRRRAMGKVFQSLITLLGVRGFRDTQCGFKMFTRESGQRIFSRLKTRGFAFDVEVLMRAREMGYQIAEVGVHWRDAEGSRVDPIRDSIRMLIEILKMRQLL
jgi:dolichyl-phosphate beta-glucosyltransferase